MIPVPTVLLGKVRLEVLPTRLKGNEKEDKLECVRPVGDTSVSQHIRSERNHGI